MYKKVYLEITNNCNLNCSFCIKNSRPSMYMSKDNFIFILDKLKSYTNYLYFHVLGEPLLHPNINEFINIANENKFKVNITTNGYLIKNIKDNKNIRQLNISLHSYNEIYNKSLEDYMNNIFEVVDNISKYTYISYRIWLKNKYTNRIIDILNKKYNTNIDINNIDNYTLDNNVFISVSKEFIWPDLDNHYYSELGTCYALKDHIGILVDGTIVPCCLDTKGIIKLGNIYKDNLTDVINSDRYQNMLDGFKHNKKCELLCKKCNFIDK